MKIKPLKNKKADMPLLLLVLGVFAICTLIIFSFIIKGTNLASFGKGSSHVGLEVFESIYSAAEKIYFYKNINYGGLSESEIEDLINEDPYIDASINGNILTVSGKNDGLDVRYTVPLN